jgi:hypothetical protein
MATSSQIIKDVVRKRAVVPLCLEKLQTVLSPSFIGILNLECAVRPPGTIEAAIPDVAVAAAISPIERIFATFFEDEFPMKNVPSTSSHDSVSLKTPEPENIVADESHEKILEEDNDIVT